MKMRINVSIAQAIYNYVETNYSCEITGEGYVYCDIVVGTRSVLDYFLEPFKKGINGSLNEK